jgi:hypothetical protein
MSIITAESRAKPGEVITPRGKSRFWDREAPLAYLFMIPGVVILLLFMAYPFFLGIYLSLTDKMVGFADYVFIGLENYQYLINSDPIFQRTVANTFIYSFVTVPFPSSSCSGWAWRWCSIKPFTSVASSVPGCCSPGSCPRPSAAWPG